MYNINIVNIPDELKKLNQWVAWKPKTKDGKIKKIPVNPSTGRNAVVTDPATWTSFDHAVSYSSKIKDAGIGFVFTENDPYVGVDLDKCLDPETGRVNDNELEIVRLLDSYTEKSPSGSGLHVIVRGKWSGSRNKVKGLEIYDRGRFFTFTGEKFPETANSIEERNDRLNALDDSLNVADRTKPSSTGATALKGLSKRFGNRFTDLWEGDYQAHYNSQSEADIALCGMLAGLTQNDALKMDELFRTSGLYRNKWDERRGDETYGEKTIQKAIQNACTEKHVQTPERKNKVIRQDFKLTDIGNGELLASCCHERLRYCAKWQSWLVWDGMRWARDEKNRVQLMAKEVIRSMYARAGEIEDDAKRNDLIKHAMRSEGNARIKAMIERASVENPIPVLPEELDQTPWLLNLNNGTMDLKTGELLPHDPERLITQLAPVSFDPYAKCPLWLSFLDQIMEGDTELIRFLQRAVGYTLTGDTGEQCLFILYGTGANGKSTFLNTISAMLGDYARKTPTETLLVKQKGAIPNDVARLAGTRLVMASEAESGQALAESLIKQMTGEDTISARFLHGEWFDFSPTHKVFLGTNHKPVVRGSDHAIWRRIRLIPFNFTISDDLKDKNLKAKLAGELAGILNWALEGCLDWQKYGLGEPEGVASATREYRQEMDVFGQFLAGVSPTMPQRLAKI